MSETSPSEAQWGSGRYRRGFWALVVTQFQGAFNDNLMRMALVLCLPGMLGDPRFPATGVAFLVFNIPYLLLPAVVGALADRYSKQRVAIAAKYLEAALMLLTALAFYLGQPYFLLALLFLMAAQSTLFSPAKYGILPEILPESRLSWGNGVIQMWTFIAIISGQAVTSPLLALFGDGVEAIALTLVLLSLVGVATAHAITRPAPADPGRAIPINPWQGMGEYVRLIRQDRWLLMTMLGIAYIWSAGVLVSQNVIELGKVLCAGNARALQSAGEAQGWLAQVSTWPSLLPAGLALGIGFGNWLAGYFSRGRIELGLVPVGALGMALFSLLLAVPGCGFYGALWLLFGLGVFAGFYDLPLAATLQERSPATVKGGMIATSNVITFAGMTVAAALFILLFNVLGLPVAAIFAVVAVMTLGVTLYLAARLPMLGLRFGLWVLCSTLFRLRVLGADNLPRRGGALLVTHRGALVEALALTAALDRPVRLLVPRELGENRWFQLLLWALPTITVSDQEGLDDCAASLQAVADAVNRGELACLFTEGQLTASPEALPFREAFERVTRHLSAPVIPVYLDRVWGSVMAYEHERLIWKVPRVIPWPVMVNIGAPMAPSVRATEVRRALQELGTEAAFARPLCRTLLHWAFIKTARRYPGRLCMADALTPHLPYWRALVGAIVLARKLRPLLGDQRMVGVLLPQSVGSSLTNIALLMLGKVPVNLNYTASPDAIASATRQCEIRHVLTAHAFLERFPVTVPGEAVYLEEVRAGVHHQDEIVALLLAFLCPKRLLERVLGAPGKRSANDLVTVIFSSGSEGEPKGVMLTHANILRNIEGMLQVFPHRPGYGIMGILPLFHSFGFTGTLWLSMVAGFFVVFHPNPLEAKTIGGLIHQYKPQFLIGTPTFLQNFIRRCLREELESLMYVVAGAEKLTARVREAFLAKFGMEPIEGYGTTECAPVVSVNVPDTCVTGYHLTGHKRGAIGRPLPGISVRVTDPDTGALLEDGTPGLLHVKGPNIMTGYLGRAEKTAEVLRDGWYNTGDIAALDEDGFLTITDRLSRFSKIAGEMVPHNKLEEVFHEIVGATEQVLAVVGVPDAAKGERLVVLHTLDDELLARLQSRIDGCGLPRLWLPKASAFYRIEALPVLGTGKLDLRGLKAMARTLDMGD